jgi:putative addiction module component (TIGR02574 family)
MMSLAMTNKIYHQALDLPTDDRMVLIDKLLHSANLPTQLEIDKLWAEEVERRCNDIETGKAKLVPGDDVFRRIRKRLAR